MGALASHISVLELTVWFGLAMSAWFSAMCLYGAWDFFSRRRGGGEPVAGWTPPVSVLKPLKGLDPELLENLRTFCDQDYPRFQLVFGAADASDPAAAAVRRLQEQHPELDIALVVDGRLHGSNHKVSNLINMLPAARHDVLVLSDSDIRVPRDYLRRVVAPLQNPKIGLVTCLYRAVPAARNLPTALWCLTINTMLTPQILVARKVEKPTYAFGATLALRRETLEAVGGFQAVANMLADDYWLGNRIAARGWALELSRCVVETIVALDSWQSLFHHQLRRARTNRTQRRGGYFGTILTYSFLWAVLGLTTRNAWASTAALGVLALRLASAVIVARRYLGSAFRASDLPLAVLTDALLVAIWALGFFGSSVWWKGRRFRVLKSGEMVAIPATSSA